MKIEIAEEAFANEVSALLKLKPEELDHMRRTIVVYPSQPMSDFDVAFRFACNKHFLVGDCSSFKQMIGSILGKRPRVPRTKKRRTPVASQASKGSVRILTCGESLVLCIDSIYTVSLRKHSDGRVVVTGVFGQGRISKHVEEVAIEFAQNNWMR